MSLMQWHEGLSVHVAEIDGQHRHFIGMINDLHAAMVQHQSKEILGRIVAGLVDYAGVHFRTEEKYFEQFAYPDAEKHTQEHEEFTRRVVGFKADYEAGVLGLSVDILQFLSDWIREHIKRVDMKYVPFFTEKGLK